MTLLNCLLENTMNSNSKNTNLIAVFDEVRLIYSSSIALKFNNSSFSYTQFFNASCHFASQLQGIGAQKGEMVGMYLDRSVEMLVGIFGILRLGGAYVPVDTSSPKERTLAIFNDANVRFVVTLPQFADLVESFGFVPLVPELIFSEASTIIFPEIASTDNAYVLFTSGSTGKPKGVMVGHESVVNLIDYIQERYPLQQGDVVLLKSPYTFDGSIWELFGWMRMGGTLLVAEPGAEKDPIRLSEIIEEQAVNFLFFVPTMLGAFLDYCHSKNKSKNLHSLKWVSVGGEVLPVQLVERFYKLMDISRVKLINVYGPTETTVYATTYLCDQHIEPAKIPIGEAVTNDFIYILNEKLEPVAFGEEGEICIGGAGVANGYLNRPELTAEKFIPNPFTGIGRMYRTGDIGRQLENGLFDFIGRRDFQVKLRGQRIEIGEIEYALQQIKELRESVVVFSKDRYGDDCLVAYLIPNKLGIDSPKANYWIADEEFSHFIEEHLSEFLPKYMIPSEIVLCREFPLNQNGKIDRGALIPISELSQNSEKLVFVPHTEIEQKVYAIWLEILGRKSIGFDEDFFVAGGHSLKAIQVITSVIREFGYEIPLKEFYAQMTLQKMSLLIQNGRDKSFKENLSTIISDPNRMEFPLTPVQRELWVVNNFDSTGLNHNIQIEFTLQGVLDQKLFIQAIKQTIQAEEIFRSIFPSIDDTPIQLILHTIDIEIPNYDLSGLTLQDKEKEYQKHITENGEVKFSFDKLPLLAFRFIKWAENDYRLLMVIHHLIFDGWSLNIFMKRLQQRYVGITPETSNYRNGDYALWLNKNLVDNKYNVEIEFWKNVFNANPKRLTLPIKPNAQVAEAGKYGERFWWNISESTTQAIERLAVEQGVTPFVVLMSAFQLVLGAAAKQTDVVVGTPFANRKHPMVEDLIGYFTNMVSIRSRRKAADTVASYLLRCNEMAIGAFSNATVPFGDVAKEVFPGFRKGTNPMFQTIFVMQNWPHDTQLSSEFTFTEREIGNRTSKMDLLLNVEKSNNEYVCWLEYDTMLYDEDFAIRLSDGINFMLESMVESVDSKVEVLVDRLNNVLNLTPRFSCILVGGGAMLVQCIEILERFNVSIQSVVSTDERIKDLAINLNIPCYTNLGDLSVFSTIDYIFSINNGILLKKEFTLLANCRAINYHDSPLPRYAGIYATNQAILHHELDHGITWHEVVDAIDAGDILLSEKVDIKPDDTSFTLNSRCFETSVWSFTKLVEMILLDKVVPNPQDLSKRTYFGLADRPASMGILNWNETSKSLSALLRACNVGPQSDNEFLMASVLINEQLYYVGKADVRKGKFGEIGEVVRYKNSLGISCVDGCVVIEQLFDSQGVEAEVDLLLVIGQIHPLPDKTVVRQVKQHFEAIAKYEDFWRNQFSKGELLPSPIVTSLVSESLDEWIDIPESVFSSIKPRWSDDDFFSLVSAIAFIFTLKLCGRKDGILAIIPKGFSEINAQTYDYFAKWIPYYASIKGSESFEELIINHLTDFSKILKRKTYCANLLVRYPRLRDQANQLPGIFVVAEGEQIPDNGMVFEVGLDSVRMKGVTEDVVTAFRIFVTNVLSNLNTEATKISLFQPNLFSVVSENINIPICTATPLEDVVSLFRKQQVLFPDKIAIFDRNEVISYHKFKADISQFSVILANNGITKGSVVAVNIDRSYHYFVAIMATLYRGAAFLPIDPSLPEDRQQYMMSDSNVSALVVSRSKHVESKNDVPVINISEVQFLGFFDQKPVEIEGDSVAYIIYTSGSSGVPKGVKISRLALANFVSGALNLYEISHKDNILQFSNLGFDASIEEIFMAFCSGASLFLREEKILSPREFLEYSVENEITVWDLPTAFWRQIIAFDDYISSATELPVRVVIIGGEAIAISDAECWSQSSPDHRLFNTYGPTETTVVALAYELKPYERYAFQIPIGRPLPGYTIHVVDENGNPLPFGMVGELLIAGDSVADGYVNVSDKQSQAFGILKHPQRADQRSYRTGDLVVSDSDGLVYYVGRKDEQLKIRGFRIEPNEIANQIEQLPDIQNCAVVDFEKKSGEKAIAAFFTSMDSKPIDVRSIKQQLFERLPNYMIPQIIYQLNHLPLTPNGKTDKRLLKQKAKDLSKAKSEQRSATDSLLHFAQNNDSESNAKRLEIVAYLLEFVRKLTDDNDIEADDDLLFSGFDSLKFIRLIVSIEREYAVKVAISDIYNYPTIGQLSQLILNYKPTLISDVVSCLREGAKGEIPLVLIWGAGQHVLQFNDLVLRLDERIPIYVLLAPLVNGEISIPDTVEELASLYLTEIQNVIKSKRIHLAGYSFGSFVVFEIAKQMHRVGLSVDKLFILDSSSVFVRHEGQVKILFETIIIRAKIWWFIKRNPLKQVRIIVKNITDKIIVYKIKRRMIEESPIPGVMPAPQFNDLLQYKAKMMTQKYVIHKAEVKIYLLTTTSHLKYGGLTMLWERFASEGVEPYYISCFHDELFLESHIDDVAQWMQRNL